MFFRYPPLQSDIGLVTKRTATSPKIIVVKVVPVSNKLQVMLSFKFRLVNNFCAWFCGLFPLNGKIPFCLENQELIIAPKYHFVELTKENCDRKSRIDRFQYFVPP